MNTTDMNDEIKNYIDQKLREQMHDGNYSSRINLFDIFGTIQTVSVVPTGIPTDIYGQFLIYNNAGTYRFYWYDFVNKEWRYSAGV